MEEQVDTVGKAFVDHYYHLFDNDRPSLSSLYQPMSMLSFESQRLEGIDNICNKLNQLPSGQCHHAISTIDTQPSSFPRGNMVFVSGSLLLPGQDDTVRSSHVSFSISLSK